MAGLSWLALRGWPFVAGPSWLGPLPRAEWTTEVGRLVGSTAAASEWANDIGTPDPDVLLVIDELRRRGLAVAILTNGTDTVPAELVELGIDARVDAVFNSAETGLAKPDAAAFAHACDQLGVEPSSGRSVAGRWGAERDLCGVPQLESSPTSATTPGGHRRSIDTIQRTRSRRGTSP